MSKKSKKKTEKTKKLLIFYFLPTSYLCIIINNHLLETNAVAEKRFRVGSIKFSFFKLFMMKKILILVLSCISLASMSFAQTVKNDCKNVVNLSTGYNHSALNTYTPGGYDNYWTVIAGPFTGSCGTYSYPSPASVISPSWGATNVYPSTQWLSFRSSASLSCNNTCASGLIPVVFERKFCMVKPDTVIIDTKMRFDNAACLYIDGTASGTLGTNIPLSTVTTSDVAAAFGGPIPSAGCQACDTWNDTKTFDSNHDTKANKIKIYLTAGTHNIQIRVRNNSSVLFGVMLTGTIKGVTQQSNFLCPNDCQVNNSIAIQKVLDKNCNGKQDAGETVGTGWNFTVTAPGGFTQTVTTDISGYAFLTGLAANTYTVTEIQQAGWTTSTPSQSITIGNNQTTNVTFYNCPKPCISISQLQVICGPINAAGVQTYNVSGLISNGNNSTVNVAATTSPGTIAGFSPATLAANATNQPFSFVYTKGANNTICYVIKLIDANGNSCLKDTCFQLPQCPTQCLDLSYTLKCNTKVSPNTPQQYVYEVVITNPTSTAINIPMTSVTGLISPSSITATPGGPTTYLVYYTPNAGTTQACIRFGTGIVPLPIPICKTPTECVPLPTCCIDAVKGALTCDKIVNGVQTYLFNGTITNNTATSVSPLIISNVPGTVGTLSPTTISGTQNVTFSFTPSGTMPSTICFYFYKDKSSPFKCDSLCMPVPNCRCADAAVLVSHCETINGVKTVVVKGVVTSGSSVPTTLSISSLNGGTATIVAGTTSVAANEVNHAFTINYVPTTYATAYCFEVTLSTLTQPIIKCKDTICVQNPCPPVVPSSKCCPTTKMKACCITTNEIKYEFTAATLPVSICGIIMTVTPAAGVLGGNIYKPAFVTGPININGTTTFASVVAGSTLTYYLTIPSTNTSNVTIKYITCAGDTCGVETFKIGKNTTISGGSVTLTGDVIKDTLFAKSYKLQLDNFIKKPKIKSISLIADDGGSNGNVFFAISGGELFGAENKALIPLTTSLQGTNSATFIFKNGIDSENYKGELLNIVITRRVKTFKVMMFDEDGLLISTSSIAAGLQAITSSKEIKSNVTSLSISPNPASEDVKMSFLLDAAQKISIDLFDISGKFLKNIDNGYRNANQLESVLFNVSEFQNGLYFIRLTNEHGQVFTEKLSVLR